VSSVQKDQEDTHRKLDSHADTRAASFRDSYDRWETVGFDDSADDFAYVYEDDAGVGEAHGTARRAHRHPKSHGGLGPESVPRCDSVRIFKSKTQHLMSGIRDTRESLGEDDALQPNLIRKAVLAYKNEEVSQQDDDNIAFDSQISNSDIQGVALAITACDTLLNKQQMSEDGKIKSGLMWKATADLNKGLVFAAKMDSLEEPMPALSKLLRTVSHSLHHPEEGLFEDPNTLDLVARAWAEVTRLRIEQHASQEDVAMMEGMQSMLTGAIPEEEACSLLWQSRGLAADLDSEAKVLEASCALASLVPIFLDNPQISTESAVGGMVPAQVGVNTGTSTELKTMANKVPNEEKLRQARLVDSGSPDDPDDLGYTEFMKAEAPLMAGSADKLLSLLSDLEPEMPKHVEGMEKVNELTPEQMKAFDRIVSKHSYEMIKLHASNPTIAGQQLEKVLVATQRVATGECTPLHLEAIIGEIQPQISRLEHKENEAADVARVLSQMHPILTSTASSEDKVKSIAELLAKWRGKIREGLMGHHQRYLAWKSDVSEFNSGKVVPSGATELTNLAAIINICESVVANGNEDMLTAANAEVKKIYRPTTLKKGVDAEFAQALDVMEAFMCNEIDESTMESKLARTEKLVKKLNEDLHVDVTKLMSAFDVARQIINHKDDIEYYLGDEKLQRKFKDVVADAWTNIITIQAEMEASRNAREMMEIIGALAQPPGESESDDVRMDEFQAHVRNHRAVLNDLIEKDKDVYHESSLLRAVSNLQHIQDPDAINVAIRETRLQLENIRLINAQKDAMEKCFDVLQLCLTERDDDNTINQCQELVQDFSGLVVFVGAFDDNAKAIKKSLVTLQRVANKENVTNNEIQMIIDQTVRPLVLRSCSNPTKPELEALISQVEEAVALQSGTARANVSESTKKQTSNQAVARNVQKSLAEHRERLIFRQRLQIQELIGYEKIVLRTRESTWKGAEWAGFYVEGVKLKHVEIGGALGNVNRGQGVELSPCREAYEAFDRNHDATVTLDEVLLHLCSVQPEDRPKGLEDVNMFKKSSMKKLLKSIDTDNDGELSFAEFEKFWGDHH
jgi:hypothetical protein